MTDEELIRKNQKTGLTVLAIVAAMIILAFASVPLYDLFCRVTGFGGTTGVSETLPDKIIDRDIKVQFNADVNKDLSWDFQSELRDVTVKIGQRGFMTYYAQNTGTKPLTGTAVYNVTPLKAGKYFHKIQCFCFDQQMLKAGEEMTMPVIFYIDPAMDADQNMDDVTTVTLSYSFFKSDSKALEEATEAFYNSED